ncbi:bifunctional DNA-formamidopyrimidine glycosylase/DNA-(apurinic or apyrimidinic site) lyase [Pararhizobium mangrovi]|uniref:Formamidopyrimidine-DNA glycosylase n=1 Tax=Pararhizobium mangrovi TaxID=2590452 RepID=A0A506TZC6_9HYPH|nr:bifunctional DNA-formamidopyrimidine glycosylase/DNA-(apurinic or apyrimidinic site) lyase [Pararhizobium mangrovi]TPW26094.1 bifunctional DNA-formamidopyrimidine glycosylase/DNA-(apurinic or apyrimidinic site) lyase [Pararhizobium mangrovi]
MPELPEVETVRRGLAPVMEAARLVAVEQRRADLRFPFPTGFSERLTGKRVTGLGRRAKYLLFDLEDDTVLIAHLGMSGSFRIETPADGDGVPGDFHRARSRDPRHDHVVLELEREDGPARVVYNDPRRFGFMAIGERATLAAHPFFAGLGPEPNGNAFDAFHLAGRMAGRNAPLKAALLDQRIVAGLGNIYVCEALWRARLSPRRKAGSLVRRDGRPTPRLVDLTACVRLVIDEAIAAGGSTLRDHMRADGTLGYFQHSFAVYDRAGEPCRRAGCRDTVRRIVQAGRSTFYCPTCQR